MAKSTRKKKETANIVIRDEDLKNQPESVLTVSTNDTTTSLIVNPQEPPPQTVISAGQPENAPVSDPGQSAPPAAPPKISAEIVEARFKKELTKYNYETALQELTDIKVTEDNLGESQQKITEARRMLTKMENIKTALKAVALQTCRWVDNSYNSLKKPWEEELAKKQTELNKVAAEQARKKEEAQKEADRIKRIGDDIDNFIIQQSQAIAGCKTNAELVTIQKLIGSHKANKSRYEEFLPDLATRAEVLNNLIKEQKKTIDELEQLEKQKAEAEAKGDDTTLIELEDKKDDLISKIAEQKVVVQETAINQATKQDTVEEATPIITTISARRTTWKAELVKKPDGSLDQKELAVAFKAGLLVCEIDPEKTRTILATLKSSGTLKDKTEIIVNGIRYYEEKIY